MFALNEKALVHAISEAHDVTLADPGYLQRAEEHDGHVEVLLVADLPQLPLRGYLVQDLSLRVA